MDSDDLWKEIEEESVLLTDYIMNLLYHTNELRLWIKQDNKEKANEVLQEMDHLLIEMRYGDWNVRD